jgi:hypothetical protein
MREEPVLPPDAGLAALSEKYDGLSALGGAGSLAAYLVTVGAENWPHAAMISVGELVVTSRGWAGLALWEHTRSAANVARSGQAVLLAAQPDRSIRARLSLRAHGNLADPDGGLGRPTMSVFLGIVDDVTLDEAPYARITSGVEFVLTDPERTIAHWRNTTGHLLALLKDLPPTTPDPRRTVP